MMIFVSFWTLNPGLPPGKIAEVAAKLMQKGLFPVKNSKVLAWYVCPGGRGVTIFEAEGAHPDEVAIENWIIWPKENPGIFASLDTYPAVTADKAVEIALK
jgi:hypothetical protein